MASPAQIQANRLNAQSSTGPRTQAGKSASRFNALKYGIEARSLVIPGEDPAELEALALEYHQHFHPCGPLEAFLVESLVQADWNRRRYARIEALVLQDSPDAVTGKPAHLIFRRLDAAVRNYFRALTELRRAQKDRQAQEPEQANRVDEFTAPAPGPQPPAPDQPSPIGFVPSNPPQDPERPAKPRVSPNRGKYRGF